MVDTPEQAQDASSLPFKMECDDRLATSPSPSSSWSTTPVSVSAPSTSYKWKVNTQVPSADLQQWFVPVTDEVSHSQHCRIAEEHQEAMETERSKAKVKQRMTELANMGQRAHRECLKQADITLSRRDWDGKIVKQVPMLLVLMSSATGLDIAKASCPDCALKEDICQNRGPAGHSHEKLYKKAILTNWMMPLLWTHIDRTAKCVGPQMGPSEIIWELWKLDAVLFQKIKPQTISAWIDRTGENMCWSDKTLEQVKRANKSGGLMAHVGFLMSNEHCCFSCVECD